MEKPAHQADLRDAALEYHRHPTPGKISVQPTKGLSNQIDLALAYSPGVAYACHAIADDPAAASLYSSRANLVGVITNGTAVLGLGNIGPLAAKPVMEGKGCLFKKFAGIDVFDIELAESDPDRLIDMIAAMEPTLGGINLEDIKAPECFYIEARLKERMSIPVFHDDQHGTAIISAAAILNALEIVGKKMDEVKVVCSGAGAAAISCLNLWCALGVRRENITVCDSKGVVYLGRELDMEPTKAAYARDTDARTLADALAGADVFLGLSTAGILDPQVLLTMASQPIVFALANPTPEIMPEQAREVRPDVIMATGRSDYANQVNNVLCFPFIFRGALDVGATSINEQMKMACVLALAAMAKEEVSDEVAMAYPGQELSFGPEYLIPKPFDPRLITTIAPAVAQAAMASGVATRPITNLAAYRDKLRDFVYRTGVGMRAVFSAAKRGRKTRIVYPDGEDERTLRAAQTILDEGLTRPILIGRPDVIAARLQRIGSKLRVGSHLEVVDPNSDARYKECWTAYHQLRKRQGVTIDIAKMRLRNDNTIIGAVLLRLGYADGMICGLNGRFAHHLRQVDEIIGKAPGRSIMAAMTHVLLPGRALFLCDTHVNEEPDAAQLAEIAIMAAAAVRRFKIRPKLAMLSHSNFGSSQSATARRVAEAVAIIRAQAPDLEVDGEMHGESALSETIRQQSDPESPLTGEANVLVMPNLDAANISYNLLKMTGGDGMSVGPILLGAARPVHVLAPTSSVRRVVDMTALVVVDAALK
ncbi:MAG TPA: NADP-dependent malic enzyme [Accumulibacter sp.]|uniref:NADP-dependent malic enzyme n=1 Tax=Accumulibacter sp. TaxID=2053492 RepID=UPI0028786911|nr:NADP-dependent malic enzyme [Accumulibacter sp.]MDS4054374.1 NADP-dependent malic enzyme [Accumulibacter sp.]HMV03946.1 NADP-dependent malic enzyme [Accumulibacter sp.]HMW80167.1 NADP-dependent malic enzyme [Accumulibacter sp.]HNB67327.1 NADP-dependent malic enzyme [Accumulibacter sp.]HND38803.1 NADP-dependent malic enzyme [Accumulibacter sp.]